MYKYNGNSYEKIETLVVAHNKAHEKAIEYIINTKERGRFNVSAFARYMGLSRYRANELLKEIAVYIGGD